MLLKEATIHFYCLFDEKRFSDICTKMELKELKCVNLWKTSEASNLVFQWIVVLNSVKQKFLHVGVSLKVVKILKAVKRLKAVKSLTFLEVNNGGMCMERRYCLMCKPNSFHNRLYVFLLFGYRFFSIGYALFSFGYVIFSCVYRFFSFVYRLFPFDCVLFRYAFSSLGYALF